jgi:hypothetical protein
MAFHLSTGKVIQVKTLDGLRMVQGSLSSSTWNIARADAGSKRRLFVDMGGGTPYV